MAKNIIFFIGDGMDLATLAATRAYIGGEEKVLSFEKFPHYGISDVSPNLIELSSQVTFSFNLRSTASIVK